MDQHRHATSKARRVIPVQPLVGNSVSSTLTTPPRDGVQRLLPGNSSHSAQLTSLAASLPPSLADTRVRDEAARQGVEVAALSSYYLKGPRRNGLVFGFGGVRPSEMRAGTRRLARAIEAAGRNSSK